MPIEDNALGKSRDAIHRRLTPLGFLSGPIDEISLEAGWKSVGENS